MNLVGKIFVGMIFVMSIMFGTMATFVYVTHTNWRDIVNRPAAEANPANPLGLRYQLENEKKRYDDLLAQKKAADDELTALRAAKTQQIAKLEAELARLRTERDASVTALAALEAKRGANQDGLLLAQTNLSRLGAQIDTLRSAIQEARGAIAINMDQIALADARQHEASGQLTMIEKRNNELVKEVAQVKELGGNGGPSGAGAEPRVEGVVLAVNTAAGLVEISLGSDDGVKMGHTMEIVRGSNYVGPISVVKVTPNRAVGQIQRERLIRPVNLGDKVTSRANLNVAAAK